MPNATNPRRQWFRYTRDNGLFFAVKVAADWGNNADSGLIAYGGAGPALGSDQPFPIHGRRNRIRQRVFVLQAGGTSLNTVVGFARTKRVMGTNTCTALGDTYVLTAGAEGVGGSVLYKGGAKVQERLARADTQPDPIPEPIGI